MISLLITSRKNDKYIAKLMFSIMTKTSNMDNIEILIMASAQDWWNKDMFEYYQKQLGDRIKIRFEDNHYGNRGLHIYFNELAKEARGEYIWYLCSDHDIILQNYDEFILGYIKEKQLDHKKIWGIVPGMRDAGPISHIISRGLYEELGYIALSDKIDSWYNDILYRVPQDRLFTVSGTQMMTDYTPQYAFIMSSDHSKIDGQVDPPDHIQNGSARYHEVINQLAQKLNEAIEHGK